MNKPELKVFLSLFLFGAMLVFISISLVMCISNWFILLIPPSFALSIVAINWLDKLFTNRSISHGWLTLATSALTLVLILACYICANPPKLSPDGYMYEGTSQITTTQYNTIANIYNKDINKSFFIELTANNPPTINYYFASLYDYDFLNKTGYYYFQTYLFNKILILGFLAFPVFLLVLAWNEFNLVKRKTIVSAT